jgi:putative ABC transport system substrate-binding protein
MNRREFIALAGAAATWPFAARAQQVGRMRQIGFLFPNSGGDPEWERRIEALMDALRRSGWIEGKTVKFTIRYAEGKPERLSAFAAELVAAKVDVVVTQGTEPIKALHNANSTIPIVMAQIGDAVGTGIIASLARPGGNVTGMTLVASETVTKRLQLVKDLSLQMVRVTALFDGQSMSHRSQIRAMEHAAPALGLTLQSLPNTSAADVDENLRFAFQGGVQVFFTLDDPLIESYRERIVGFAMQNRIPVIAENRPLLTAGALMSYSPNLVEMWRGAAAYVDKILKGARPADLPVEQPTKFELGINLKSAKALGLEISPSLQARADEVIE